MLFHERKREREIREAEAAGDRFWTEKFTEDVRGKIWFALKDSESMGSGRGVYNARGILLRSTGKPYLYRGGYDAESDLRKYLLVCDDEMMPSVIEAMDASLVFLRTEYGIDGASLYEDRVREVMLQHRISFDLIRGQMVPFDSREMHVGVIVPTLQLLAGRTDLNKVETAYQDALAQISQGQPGNAITDAGTALQEMLDALGCRGNALGPLIKSARSKELIAPHDEKLLNWVAADRSGTGDDHHSTDAVLDDAWMIVHVVGAIILRLAGSPRGHA